MPGTPVVAPKVPLGKRARRPTTRTGGEDTLRNGEAPARGRPARGVTPAARPPRAPPGPGDKDWGWGSTRGPMRTRPARRGAPGASSSSPGPSGAPGVDRLPPRTAEHAGPAVGACGCPRPLAPRTQAPRPDTHLGGRVPGRAPPVGVQRQAGGAGRPDSLPASACRAKTSPISVPPPHSASSAPLWGAGSQDGATPTGTAPAPGHEAHGGARSWALWPHSRLPPAEQPDPQPSGGWPRSGDPAGAEQCHGDGCGLGLDVPSPRGAVSAQAVPTSPSVCLSVHQVDRWQDGAGCDHRRLVVCLLSP